MEGAARERCTVGRGARALRTWELNGLARQIMGTGQLLATAGLGAGIDELERRLDGAERGESLLVGASAAAASVACVRIPYLVVFLLPASEAPLPAAAGAQEPLQHYGQRSFAQSQPASFQNHGQLLAQPQPQGPGRAHTPQALHEHLGTLGAKANNEKKGPPDCHAAPGAPLSKNLPRRRQRRPEQHT
ncbi:hypothetical protein P7K49_000319 [Saguinus oedipus]|uniref:Uncharacterized protein n=1 Tax=Saguinus oedipus TaxID=9490 RepID=A0ABQ9WBB1_SAGOE|nr:hypothetical protein P7K49_000319 [Saguinus oedipus]